MALCAEVQAVTAERQGAGSVEEWAVTVERQGAGSEGQRGVGG